VQRARPGLIVDERQSEGEFTTEIEMKKILGMLFALSVVASPALAQKITIDYAHEFDFSTIKTFQYNVNQDGVARNPLVDDRIKSAIIQQLVAGGLSQVAADPDMYITYGVTTQDNTVYSTTGMGYGGYRRGWGGYGYGGVRVGVATTTASTFTEGTLIIDAYEPEENKMVWRGTGTVTVKGTPEKQAKQVDKILLKMGSKWRKILENQGE
jgi:hypothetical protein